MTYNQDEFEKQFRGLFENVFTGENFENMRKSAWYLAMVDHAHMDLTLALQIGAALLMDKPLVIVATNDTWISPRLYQVADGVIRISGPNCGLEEKQRMRQELAEILSRRQEKKA